MPLIPSRWLSAALLAATLVVYAPVRNFAFVNLDDGTFLYHNAHVREGMTSDSIRWALLAGLSPSYDRVDYWQPITHLSRLLDVEIFGLSASGHHVVNLLFHLANVLLVHRLFRRISSSAGAALFVAGVFALHPVQVESVAWVTERKNLLGALFGLGALDAYLSYAAAPGRARLLGVAVLFAMSLLSKPIFLPLPFLLFALDLWPLRRPGGMRALAIEKVPFLLLAIASAWITLQTPTPLFEERIWSERASGAPVSLALYLQACFFPVNFAVLYPPHDFPIPLLRLTGASLLLSGVTYSAIRFARKIPAFAFGWFWFLALLAPVIFLTETAMADRFLYVAHLGLSSMIAGTITARRDLAVAGAVVLLALGVAARSQVETWRNTASLFEHAIRVAPPGHVYALGILGQEYIDQGRYRDARRHLLTAIELNSGHPAAWVRLGNLALLEGDLPEARLRYIEAARLDPEDLLIRRNRLRLADPTVESSVIAAKANFDLGIVLGRDGKVEEAIYHLSEAIRLRPSDNDARARLAVLWAATGRIEAARSALEEVLRRDPTHSLAREALGEIGN